MMYVKDLNCSIQTGNGTTNSKCVCASELEVFKLSRDHDDLLSFMINLSHSTII